jgi:lantibiotic modifying enzyme
VPEWMSASILATSFVFTGNNYGVPPRYHSGLSAACLEQRSRVFDDEDVLGEQYVSAVTGGFRKAYDFLLPHRHLLTLDHAPLRWLSGRVIRTLPRSTAFYTPLADILTTTPARWRAAIMRQVEYTLCHSRGRGEWPAAFIRAEMCALARGDVPYWTLRTDSFAIHESGSSAVAGVVARTALDALHHRLCRLSPGDRDDQAWLIETFLRVRDGEKV